MAAPLLAKSFDQRFLYEELQVAGHCVKVMEAARILAEMVGADVCRMFEISEEDWEALKRRLIIAALFHDLGKANNYFQDTVKKRSQSAHPFTHEFVSALMLYGEPSLRDPLERLLGEDGFWVMLTALLGHHLRVKDSWQEPKRVGSSMEFLLGDPSLALLWSKAQELCQGVTVPKTKQARVTALGDELAELADELALFWDERAAGDVKQLSVLKSLLITADIIGSGLSVPQSKALYDFDDVLNSQQGWINDVFGKLLSEDVSELEPLISSKLNGRDPHDFQLEVRDHQGPVTLVTAGCGNGKTLAAYLWASKHAGGRRLVFCYPTTGTSTAGFADYLLEQAQLGRALAHSRAAVDVEKMLATSEQDDPLMELWADDVLALWGKQVVVCTVDTVLSMLTMERKGFSCLSMWSQSVFVFDEIHSYDTKLYGALLSFLKHVQAPCLLMTASLSRERHCALECALGAQIAPICGNPQIESAPRYTLDLRGVLDDEAWQEGGELFDKIVKAVERGLKVLVVCNTVSKAQQLFQSCSQAKWAADVPIHLYHSRFRYEDRVERQNEVILSFGPENQGAAVVFATQVCEMSLDISADLLITELAPLPSLIQRLGRLNRHPSIPASPKLAVIVDVNKNLPYEAGALEQSREILRSLGGGALSQLDLAMALNQVQEPPFEARDEIAFLSKTVESFGTPLREAGHTITVIREEELACFGDPKKPTRMELIENAIPMLCPDKATLEKKTHDLVRGVRVIKANEITYDTKEGARWAR